MTKTTAQSLMLQRQLIQYLADGQTCSGEWLATQIGISRAAISRHIDQLQQLGLDIYAVTGKGYRLAEPIQLLDLATIKAVQSAGAPEIWLQHLTDSTNSQLLKRLQEGHRLQKGQALVAECQTAGRGRRGNNWYSPFGSNLYFSLYWQLEQGIQAAMGLSLVVGIAIAQLLEEHFQLAVQLKWPNDLYANGQKLGGILVELSGQAHANCDLVIGIGLNVQMPAAATQSISQAFTDLNTVRGVPVERNRLVGLLQQALIAELSHFEINGFASYVTKFNQRNEFANREIVLTGAGEPNVGCCIGVDAQGGLLIDSGAGPKAFYGGELSLRGVTS